MKRANVLLLASVFIALHVSAEPDTANQQQAVEVTAKSPKRSFWSKLSRTKDTGLPSAPAVGVTTSSTKGFSNLIPESTFGKVALGTVSTAVIVNLGYFIYTRGIVGKAVNYIKNTVNKHPKKTIAAITAIVTAAIAYKMGYLDGLVSFFTSTKKVTGTVEVTPNPTTEGNTASMSAELSKEHTAVNPPAPVQEPAKTNEPKQSAVDTIPAKATPPVAQEPTKANKPKQSAAGTTRTKDKSAKVTPPVAEVPAEEAK
jgi:hypothetical protein